MKFSLLVLTPGKQEGKLIEIKLPQFLVGRDPQCHLRPASPLISKRHCVLIQRDGKAFIRDFDSTNGSFVNDEAIKGERELHHNDQLKIGPIAFTVQLEKEVAPDTPTPPPATKAAGKPPASGTKPGTPAPATAKKGTTADDDIAAMLLSIEGDEAPTGPTDAQGVPEGSTIMEMKVPTDDPAAAAAAAGKDDKKGAKPAGTGDTRSAAANILEKMMKRPRT
jgi:pSer/pThr/pTyr-binding forkhead associated (FHA) protein